MLGVVGLVLLVTLGTAATTLLRSYRFYASVIEARLASGYLTSRPGIYAAPRTIALGQKSTREALAKVLRRAGYADTKVSNVWSGSFTAAGNIIEISPSRIHETDPSLIRILFDAEGRVVELKGDGHPLDRFTLEPELLSNDASSRNGQRTQLTYSELPPLLVQAILSIEDRRFFTHRGVDLFGMARALLRNVGDDRTGQGGSTITQQLVKNTYLSPERTYKRKFAEAMLAFALERRLSKEDIFALYCNEVFLGQRGTTTVRGVEQAARLYFGKNVRDLSASEAATIAGMIQGPTRYSPERHPESALARRNTVLGTMTRDGWLSLEQAAAAAKEPVTVVQSSNDAEALAPYFIDYVNRSNEDPASPGQERVYTTIDLDLQTVAEAAIRKQLERLDQTYKNGDARPQAAIVALDPHSGAVLAMVGGRNYAETQLNRATDAYRQPGSTFKPFVYAAALESGISPGQMFKDAPQEFIYDGKRSYRPANFGGGFSMRDVTMRTGLVKSLNVVTVDIAMQTGLARTANLAEQFGLPKPARYPSLALGTTEVTPLQLAAAYAAFVRGGETVTPYAIASTASPAIHARDNPTRQVIKATTAYMITNMLSAVIDHGTARAARGAVKGTAIAGKTGTSRDGWFVGYTPSLVCVVWIGFDDNQQLGLTGAEAALPAWTEFMNGAVQLRPELGGKNFECPEGIKFVEIDTEDGLLSTLSCPTRELIAVTDALAPNADCFKHGNVPGAGGEAQPQIARASHPTVAPQRSKPDTRKTELNPWIATRTDVDARGRRTLINELR